eukprot:1844715-Amphidinium_carterae.6
MCHLGVWSIWAFGHVCDSDSLVAECIYPGSPNSGIWNGLMCLVLRLVFCIFSLHVDDRWDVPDLHQHGEKRSWPCRSANTGSRLFVWTEALSLCGVSGASAKTPGAL